RQLVEAGLDDAQPRAGRDLFQPELDEGGGLAAVVCLGIDRIGMPGEREQPLRLHLLHHRLPAYVLVARIGDVPTRHLSGHERPFEPDAEPRPELLVIGQRAPDAGHRSLEIDSLLDAIGHSQPPGCVTNSAAEPDTRPFCCVYPTAARGSICLLSGPNLGVRLRQANRDRRGGCACAERGSRFSPPSWDMRLRRAPTIPSGSWRRLRPAARSTPWRGCLPTRCSSRSAPPSSSTTAAGRAA